MRTLVACSIASLVFVAACAPPQAPPAKPEPSPPMSEEPARGQPEGEEVQQQSVTEEDAPSEAEMEEAPITNDDAGDVEDPSDVPTKFDAEPKPKTKDEEDQSRAPAVLSPRAFIAQPAARAKLRVHFIDIGQGDATLVQCPNGANILVDFGSHTGGEARARAYLRKALNGGKIDDLVVTHPDGDHYNRLHVGLDGITVDQAWIVGSWSDYAGHDNQASKQWLQAMEAAGKLKRMDQNGPHHDTDTPHPGFDCGEADVWVVAAGVVGRNAGWRKNTMSIVLVITYGEFDVVLTGDATTETEEQMIEWHCPTGWKPGDDCWLNSELLKMGHHGSKTTSTGARWAAAVSPQVAIASATQHEKHGHPSKDAVLRLHPYTSAHPGHKFLWWTNRTTPESIENYEETIYSTAVNRHIRVESDGVSYEVLP